MHTHTHTHARTHAHTQTHIEYNVKFKAVLIPSTNCALHSPPTWNSLHIPPLTLFESNKIKFVMRNQPLAAPELLNNMVCNCRTTWYVTVEQHGM